MEGGADHGQMDTRGTNDKRGGRRHRLRRAPYTGERDRQPHYRLGGGDMVSDRDLEHPAITRTLRTGYPWPRGWEEEYNEEEEHEYYDDKI